VAPTLHHGIGVSPGIAIGRALVVEHRVRHVPRLTLPTSRLDAELARLDAAADEVRRELGEIEERAGRELGTGIAQIIEAQLMMLDDDSFLAAIRDRVREHGHNAEWAVKEIGDDLSDRFARISDDLLRERGNDLDDLASRVLRQLCGVQRVELEKLQEPVVLLSYDLSPADTAVLNRRLVLGFGTDAGGRTSHTAIMARSLEIPAVVGINGVSEAVRTGDLVILDGNDGRLIVDPEEATVLEYDERRKRQIWRHRELLAMSNLPARTPDGFEVRLLANVESAEEIPAARDHGALGVGLFRSEYLYLRSWNRLPTEEDHYREYRSALEGMAPAPVAIRTLDLGGEKDLPSDFGGLREDNALLGLRGIRHSLHARELFVAQVRGLLRASIHGDLRIVLPFVSGIEEVREARAAIEDVRAQLLAEGAEVTEQIPIGIMLEVPAAALVVDHLAEEADFLSVGTNDLIQYLLAVDRTNDAVSQLHNPLHPAVLRLLDQIVRAARARSIPLTICGETAADPLTAMVLLGFGIEELSMVPSAIPVIRNMIRRVKLEEARQALTLAMELRTAREVEELALEHLMAHFPDGFMIRQ
jgi:phosphotransferase system enzyme I (PtsI)